METPEVMVVAGPPGDENHTRRFGPSYPGMRFSWVWQYQVHSARPA
jgi:hypothetical protein